MCISPEGRITLSLIEDWEKVRLSDQKKNQISILVDGQGFVFFFIYHSDIFACQEPSRVTFARMKTPDKETTPGWLQEANFMAINLTKAISGQPVQQIFKSSDLPDIHVINNKDTVYHLLAKQAETVPSQKIIQTMKSALSSMPKTGDV